MGVLLSARVGHDMIFGMIPVAFFQAGATIIPTLLIAMAVTSKQGEKIAQGVTSGEHGKVTAFFMVLVFAFVVVGGEFAALWSIADGGGNRFTTILVTLAIFACLTILLGELTAPILALFSKRWNWAFVFLLSIGMAVALDRMASMH